MFTQFRIFKHGWTVKQIRHDAAKGHQMQILLDRHPIQALNAKFT